MITPIRFCAAALAACSLALCPLPAVVLPAALAESEAATGEYLQTAKQSNMRKEPDKRSDIREKLKKGTKVEVLDRVGIGENAWAYIRVVKTGKKGYIMADLLEPSKKLLPLIQAFCIKSSPTFLLKQSSIIFDNCVRREIGTTSISIIISF